VRHQAHGVLRFSGKRADLSGVSTVRIMSRTTTLKSEAATPPIQSLQAFITGMGIKPITAWRMRKKRWLTTINIAGRQYITADAVAEFMRRAEAGDFAKVHPTPKRKSSTLP
jgi:hypothetical protein